MWDINLLAEKKSLIRFLLIYILSTLFLIGIGEYFYYKLAKNSLIQNQKMILENKINNYLKQGFMFRMLRNTNLPKNMAIYEDKQLFSYNFNPPKIDFKTKLFIRNNKIFFMKTIIRRFRTVYILTYKNIPKTNLLKNLLIFNFFLLIFISFIGYSLGKIFLAPMKKTIEDLESFITDTTHEMNTPISVIMANIEILEMKEIKNKEFQRIKNSAKRLTKIFEDLKFITLNPNLEKELKNINLKELILERVEYFEIKPKIKLENKVIKVDKEEIIRIIDNLLSNSKKYSKQFIDIQLNNKYLLIKNDGEIKNIKNITNKFIRENKNEGGFGVGLYIVEKIIQKYGWKLEIQSKNSEVLVYIYF